MNTAKLRTCLALVLCLSLATAGCGVTDLLTAAGAAGKLFGGSASEVNSNEWQVLSRTAADLAGTPDLALSVTEADAVSSFLETNEINSIDSIESIQNLEGLQDLATAFQERAGDDYDLGTAEGAQSFFEDYGQDLALGLQEALSGFGVDIPSPGGEQGGTPDGGGDDQTPDAV
jgi:hypothetical protein